jgi:hypothetical protein
MQLKGKGKSQAICGFATLLNKKDLSEAGRDRK